ncbi:TPMT family [Penicillium hordei]|uniref:TPMT family n=1 Tax=Penicillium hordei TaxID=40994 RepID=A0AAD6H009_9EURO|nr:TPMT family [Penicillium hordei]KAJ5597424.1 TPMT family [Penicillium hordei]
MTESEKPLNQEEISRLLKHFSGEGPPANDRWAALWDAGDFLPWDQGIPNPALVHVMENRQDLIGASAFIHDGKGECRRKRALVPGCGRGYDVLLLSSLGYDAYGLDVSTKAAEEANAWAGEHLADYPVRDQAAGPGKAQFIIGDFFSDEWIARMDLPGKFEIIYDYTFFCALTPDLRSSWARRYWDLLSTHQESVIVCVEFPTQKKLSLGGPPYASPSSVYLAHLSHPGQEIRYDVEGAPLTELELENANGFQRVGHWKAEKSHPMGKGMDWVSVWRRSDK